MSVELLPCPFCGYDQVSLIHYSQYDPMAFDAVHCGKCGTQGPYGDDFPDPVKAWNARTADLRAIDEAIRVFSECGMTPEIQERGGTIVAIELKRIRAKYSGGTP